MTMTQRILFVSDGTHVEPLRQALEEHGFEVSFEEDGARAHAQRFESAFDLLIIDLNDSKSAVDLMKRVRSERKLSTALVLVMAQWGTGQATLALSNGADAFEPKPINAKRLVAAVEKLLRPRMVMTATATATNGESDADE